MMKLSKIAFGCFLLACGVLSAIWVFNRPLIGDDLFYASDLEARGGGLTALPRMMAAVWGGCNGRWGDITNTVWLSLLPRWVTAAFAFLCTVILPVAAMKLAGIRPARPLAVAVMMLMLVLLLPWWDMTHLVCLINYPWGAAVLLVCLLPLVGDGQMNSRWWIPGLPVAFMGAAWHEASGVAIVGGLLFWIVTGGGWRRFFVMKRWWIAALVAGGLFTLSSPAIWHRIGSSGSPDGSPAYILLTSANLSAVLAVALALTLIFNRTLFARLLRDRFALFAVASLASACAAIVGGVVGRAGLFAQLFAVIALLRIPAVAGWRPVVPGRVGAAFAVGIYVGLLVFVVNSYRRSMEVTRILKEAHELYPQNRDAAYRLVMDCPPFGQWDAAALKALDPRYDSQVDRNETLQLHAEQ